jgi:hypothetical protein
MVTYPPSGFAVDMIICDSAVVAEGKLYIQGGGWNVLHSATFPFQQDRVGIAAVVSVPYTATNQTHRLQLWIEDQDGEQHPIGIVPGPDGTTNARMRVEAQFNLGRPPILQAGDSQNLPIAINLDHLVFTSPGAYSFVLAVDDVEMERHAFRVVSMTGMGVAVGG